ncbi:hypothetical protein [Azospirillum melinis]
MKCLQLSSRLFWTADDLHRTFLEGRRCILIEDNVFIKNMLRWLW